MAAPLLVAAVERKTVSKGSVEHATLVATLDSVTRPMLAGKAASRGPEKNRRTDGQALRLMWKGHREP